MYCICVRLSILLRLQVALKDVWSTNILKVMLYLDSSYPKWLYNPQGFLLERVIQPHLSFHQTDPVILRAFLARYIVEEEDITRDEGFVANVFMPR